MKHSNKNCEARIFQKLKKTTTNKQTKKTRVTNTYFVGARPVLTKEWFLT